MVGLGAQQKAGAVEAAVEAAGRPAVLAIPQSVRTSRSQYCVPNGHNHCGVNAWVDGAGAPAAAAWRCNGLPRVAAAGSHLCVGCGTSTAKGDLHYRTGGTRCKGCSCKVWCKSRTTHHRGTRAVAECSAGMPLRQANCRVVVVGGKTLSMEHGHRIRPYGHACIEHSMFSIFSTQAHARCFVYYSSPA